MPFLSVYGHIIVDTILDTPKIPEDEEFTGINDFHIRYGGTGANIAINKENY
jgi:sugar/nucleoside kinase (ribokinase family)